MYCRKIQDYSGNCYIFEFADDVNPNNIEDILLGCDQRIGKVIAYRLDGDCYRHIKGDEPIGKEAARFNRPPYMLLRLADPEDNPGRLSQEEFGKMMVSIIAKSKEERINKPRVEWNGLAIHYQGDEAYVLREFACSNKQCRKPIKGKQRLSRDSEGQFTRTQHFIPDDKNVSRTRPGSKSYLCGECAVRHLTPEEAGTAVTAAVVSAIPELAGDAIEAATAVFGQGEVFDAMRQAIDDQVAAGAADTEEPEEKTPQDILLQMLEKIAAPDSEVSAEYVKGFAYAVVLAQREGKP